LKVSIEGEYLKIETDRKMTEPYIRRTVDGYKAYWHFIRDFNSDYNQYFEVTDELKGKLKELVQERNRVRAILNTETEVKPLSDLLAGEFKQYQFQARAVRFIEEQKKVLLADDVGLGKTMIALSSMLSLIETQGLTKFFVVVPASLRFQWLSECRKFINRDMFPDMELVINNKSQKERNFVYRNFEETDNPIILITSYDMVRRDKDRIRKLNPDMLVMDEATKVKTRTTKINKAIRRMFKDTEYKLAMTATPIENGFEDLYCIAEIVDAKRLHSKRYFESQYCKMEKTVIWRPRRIEIYKVIGYRNIEDAQEKLAGMYVRRTVDEVELELPEIIQQNIELELKPEQRRMYQEITGSIFGEMTREDILGKMVYLQELCDSAQLLDSNKRASVKLDEIKRLLDEDFRYSKVILITQFKKFANIIEKELSKLNPLKITGDTDMSEREFIVKEFNENPEARVLIGTEAIQEGLNLQVASVLVNVDLPWNPAKLNQRIGRLHRLSSKHKTIRVVNLTTKGTIEDTVMETLYEKGKLFEQMFKRDKEVKIGSLLGMSSDELLDIIGRG